MRRAYTLMRRAGPGKDEPQVLGSYVLCAGAVAFAGVPRGVRKRRPCYPVVHLARLAVDARMQGHQLGEALLVDALLRALAETRNSAVFAVEVRAGDAPARAFYMRYGFMPLEDDPLRLYLPIETIRQLYTHST